jgi:hypothetical protein
MRILPKRLLGVYLLASLAIAAPAWAQEEGGGSVSASGSVEASAGGGAKAAGIGVGAETMLTGTTIYGFGILDAPASAASVVYDASRWRIHGLLAMDSAGATDVFVGGKFFFNLHTGTASDFAVGGGLGIASLGGEGPGDDDRTDIFVEGAVMLRAFVVPNVAIGASAGVGFVIIDEEAGDDFFFLGGQLLGSIGIWYFFD